MIVVQVATPACNGVMYIHPGALDPGKMPCGPHLGSHPNQKSAPTQANTFNGGYPRHYRFRNVE
ncbi:hypothetical protein Godav_006084 [Gossypium davidsonii]|uniref:Uncharacterized protein n=1 Tax=Gossypium davidsonii TaxID=34287 RepID=A0A7J8S2K7_GOSDV|nr:hypothetical protein [Gossypium davidsonii]